MALWHRLPAEIRINILDLVAHNFDPASETHARAGYASVCQEWQPIFEYWNFKRLVLDQDRVFGLEQFMGTNKQHRRCYLKHISLNIRLDEYDCKVCQSEEDTETIKRNNEIFSEAIWNLLVILSKWATFSASVLDGLAPGAHRHEGITLEFGVYSPSDYKHTFRDFHLEHDYPYQKDKGCDYNRNRREAYNKRVAKLAPENLNDPYHGWYNGHREKSISMRSKQRIIGNPLAINTNLPRFSAFCGTFPEVDIVIHLLIPRRFYRRIEAQSLGKILQSLTHLSEFRHECWRSINPQQQSSFEQDYAESVPLNLPAGLQRLYIYEEFKLHNLDRTGRHANANLGKALSDASRSLLVLSVAHLVDAEDFFTDFWPGKADNPNTVPWKNLVHLVLTTRLLLRSEPERHPEIRKLLIAAGRAAAFMPKLRSMQIWNKESDGHYGLFSYTVNFYGKPVVKMLMTSGVYRLLNRSVRPSWKNLPQRHQYPHPPRHVKFQEPCVVERSRPGEAKINVPTRRDIFSSILDTDSYYQLGWEESHPEKVLESNTSNVDAQAS